MSPNFQRALRDLMKSELLCGVAALIAAVGFGVGASHSVTDLHASPDAPVSSSAAPPSPSPAPATQEPETGGNPNPGADGGGGGGGGG
jgi:hypothetical protein